MPTSYHRFAGSSLERLAALSDGVFAVAMTLLVLDLKPPSVRKRASPPSGPVRPAAPSTPWCTTFCTTSPRGCSRTR
ncbi:MAG: DUF1211 domain-containing protein [Solirubrobacterales bacterium]|nr:DUF1211 domain-containing protein [Solirubrobacterales bacterium]